MTPDILKQLLIDAIYESSYLGSALIMDDIVNDVLTIELKNYKIILNYSIERK